MRFLYLHGFASSPHSRKARAFAAALEMKGIPLECPDLARGDFEHLTISGQLECVEDLLHGEPARLVGSSMGGYLAALYAASHPEVERLVLLAPAFGFAGSWKDTVWRKSGYREFFHHGDGALRRVHYKLIEDALHFPPNPDVECPVRIFHGLNDAVVPIERSRYWSAHRPNVQLTELESDHELLDVLSEITEQAVFFLNA